MNAVRLPLMFYSLCLQVYQLQRFDLSLLAQGMLLYRQGLCRYRLNLLLNQFLIERLTAA